MGIDSLFRTLSYIEDFRTLFTDWLFIPLLVLAAAIFCLARCLLLAWRKVKAKTPIEQQTAKSPLQRWLWTGIGLAVLYLLLLWPVGLYDPWMWVRDLLFTLFGCLLLTVPVICAVKICAKPKTEWQHMAACIVLSLWGCFECLGNFVNLYYLYLTRPY